MRTPAACITALLLMSCDDPATFGSQAPVADPDAPNAIPELPIVPAHDEELEDEPEDPMYWSHAPRDPLAAIDCAEHTDTGYKSGNPFEITVVTVDGKPVEVQTANAFHNMAQAAAKDGVTIKVVSGFRTMAEQQYLYNCYINCNCNNCNLAAKPGYSNHQSGHALDLNTGVAAVNNWLKAHGNAYGFEATVPSEAWHWEWWGGGPAVSGPCGQVEFKASFVAQSFPFAADPALEMKVGDVVDAWIDLKNEGTQTWTGNTKLSPTPRDVASPLTGVDWLSPTRITAPDVDTPSGGVGRFSFKLGASAPGEYYQYFGLVEEGVTWFSDGPKGGGPPDNQLQIRVLVTEAPLPPDETTSGGPDLTTGGGESGGSKDETGGTSLTSAGETGNGEVGTGGGEGEAGDPPTTGGPESEGSGDLSEGAGESDDGPGGAALPDGYGSDEGCGCRNDRNHARGDGLLGLGLGLLLWARRRRAG
jgi:hypothetical protein